MIIRRRNRVVVYSDDENDVENEQSLASQALTFDNGPVSTQVKRDRKKKSSQLVNNNTENDISNSSQTLQSSQYGITLRKRATQNIQIEFSSKTGT
jgi:hypothetical protein